MDRSKFLWIALFILAISFSSLGVSNAYACSLVGMFDENCPDGTPPAQAIVVGPGVDLTADATSGSSGSGTSQARPRRGGTTTTAPPRVCANGDPAKPGIKTIPCGNGSFLPFATNPTPTTPCTVCSPTTIVRITDLHNFPAYPTPTAMEPAGWAIVGLATNFWAAATPQLGEGLLLGQPAQVMFTPTSYHWNYGDGTTTTSPTSGARWETLGLPEFTETPTSHKYTATGTYSVTLTVNYRADYSFGDQGWRPVQGTVTVPSTPITLVAARESTVLVAEDCNTNPHGPGC